MSAFAGGVSETVAAAVPSETKPLTPRSILRRDVPSSSAAVEGVPRKRVTFEGNLADEKPNSGGRKLQRRGGSGCAARAAARRSSSGNGRGLSLLRASPAYPASSGSASSGGHSPPSTSCGPTTYDVRAPGRARRAGCHSWSHARSSSSLTPSETSQGDGGWGGGGGGGGNGGRFLSSVAGAGTMNSRGRRMFQVQDQMNRAAKTAVAAAAAASPAASPSVSPSVSPSTSPGSITARNKRSPQQQQRQQQRQQQQRQAKPQHQQRRERQQDGEHPLCSPKASAYPAFSETPRATAVAPTLAVEVAAARVPCDKVTSPSSADKASSTTSSAPSPAETPHRSSPASSANRATAAAATGEAVEVEHLEELLLCPPPEHAVTVSVASPMSVCTLPETDESNASGSGSGCGSGSGVAGTAACVAHAPRGSAAAAATATPTADACSSPQQQGLQYREYAAGATTNSPEAKRAPAKEDRTSTANSAEVIVPSDGGGGGGDTRRTRVPAESDGVTTACGANGGYSGTGENSSLPPAAAAVASQQESSALPVRLAAEEEKEERVEVGSSTAVECNPESGTTTTTTQLSAISSPLVAAPSVSVPRSGLEEHSQRSAPESKSTCASPKCLAKLEEEDAAPGPTPSRSQHLPPVVTPPADDQLGRGPTSSRDGGGVVTAEHDGISQEGGAGDCGRRDGLGGSEVASSGGEGSGSSSSHPNNNNNNDNLREETLKRKRSGDVHPQSSIKVASTETKPKVSASAAVFTSPVGLPHPAVLVDESPPLAPAPAPGSPNSDSTTIAVLPSVGSDSESGLKSADQDSCRGSSSAQVDVAGTAVSSPSSLQQQQQQPQEVPETILRETRLRLLPARDTTKALPAGGVLATTPASAARVISAEQELALDGAGGASSGNAVDPSKERVKEGKDASAAFDSSSTTPAADDAVGVVAEGPAHAKPPAHHELKTVSGRVGVKLGRLPARQLDRPIASATSTATAAVLGCSGGGDRGRHKRVKRPSRKMLEVREGKERDAIRKTPAAAAVVAAAAAAAPAAAATSDASVLAQECSGSDGQPIPAADAVVAAGVVGRKRKRGQSTRRLQEEKEEEEEEKEETQPVRPGGAVSGKRDAPPLREARTTRGRSGASSKRTDSGGGGVGGGDSMDDPTPAKRRRRGGGPTRPVTNIIAPPDSTGDSSVSLSEPTGRDAACPAAPSRAGAVEAVAATTPPVAATGVCGWMPLAFSAGPKSEDKTAAAAARASVMAAASKSAKQTKRRSASSRNVARKTASTSSATDSSVAGGGVGGTAACGESGVAAEPASASAPSRVLGWMGWMFSKAAGRSRK